MGTVYLAHDPLIDRLVAIKLLRPGADAPSDRARLAREAKAAGRLIHQNIATIFGVGECDGRPYVVMEFVEGQPLSALIRDGIPASVSIRLRILEGLCAGLARAHDAGLVHRDIKPANVMVNAEWQPKLVDFGLALLSDASLQLTGEHAVVGTLSYMSPEQLSKGVVDARSDLFSLGVLAYELLSFRRAFTGDTGHVVARILAGTPDVAVEALDVGADLKAVLARALRSDPASRFSDARAFGEAIRRVRLRTTADDSSEVMRSVADVPPFRSVLPSPPAAGDKPAPGRRYITLPVAVAVSAASAALLYAVVPRTRHAQEVAPRSRADVISTSRIISPAAPDRPRPSVTTQVQRSTVPITTPMPTREPAKTPMPPATDAAVAPQPLEQPALPELAVPRPRLPIGAELMVRLTSTLDTRRIDTGDRFHGRLDAAVEVRDGQRLPAGTDVEGQVDQVGGVDSGRPFLHLSLTSIAIGTRQFALRTGVYRVVAPGNPGGASVAAIVIGGIAGGVFGAAVGGRDASIAGAAIGGAVGAAARGAASTDYRIDNALPFRIAQTAYLDEQQ